MPPGRVTRRHSASAGADVGHEVQDEAGHHRVERVVGELQRRGVARREADPRVVEGGRRVGDEVGRRVDADHRPRGGRPRIAAVSAPVPQPRSSQARPAGSASQSMKSTATRRLQRPTYDS